LHPNTLRVNGFNCLHMSLMSLVAAAPPRVLLGVMSNPSNPRMRTQQREWGALFAAPTGVDVRFVVGETFHNRTQPPPMEWPEIAAEQARHSDFIVVEGRERLPHVGVVTEKSASFWLRSAAAQPAYGWYCKCDDDTLVHHERLGSTLRNVTAALGAGAKVLCSTSRLYVRQRL